MGWTLDAFDFFVVIFLVDTLAGEFHVTKAKIILSLTATLAMRPVGAIIFGLLADRFGRRAPLMGNVIFYSIIGFSCGFAPNYAVFLVLRALYGIGMGGEWGVGASLALEAAPQKLRGLLSGILQSGYSIGYLLAAIAARTIYPHLGWRWMFWIGALPALLALYIRSHVPESEAWKQHRAPDFSSIFRVVGQNMKLFFYLLLLLTLFTGLSHGTQDLYPDFLKSQHGIAPNTVANLAMLYNIGAIVGAIIFGHLSEKLGRRYSIAFALLLSLCTIPLWAFGSTVVILAAASFVMQVGVQGAWGVMPAHLNELVPDSVRGLLPGMAYQLGVLIGAPTNSIEYALRDRFGYQWAIAGFEIAVIVLLMIVTLAGRENKGKAFHRTEALPSP